MDGHTHHWTQWAQIWHGASIGPGRGQDDSGHAQQALWRAPLVWPYKGHLLFWSEGGLLWQKIIKVTPQGIPQIPRWLTSEVTSEVAGGQK